MRSIATLIAAAFTTVGCAAPAPDDATDPRALRAAGAPILDVRTSQEWRDGHIEGAVLLPVQELEARIAEVDRLVGGDRTRPLIVVCRSGARAEQARTMLRAHGYSAVVNGGAWTALR